MKSNVLPNPVQESIREILTAVFQKELPNHSEQFIRAMVNREIDKIKKAKIEKEKSKSVINSPIELFIRNNVVVPLHELGAENIRLQVFETERGRVYELVFETAEDTEYQKYCRAYEKGGYFPDPRD